MGNSNGKPVSFSDEVNLNHFRLLGAVGKGTFGKVRIAERKDTGIMFALKYIRKDEVVRSESVRNVIRERRMLEHLSYQFICNLRYSFQDIEYMYLVLDLMSGGDLRFHISRKTFTEEAVRFWIAELGCALRYIHKQGIIHRDIKPDNVLLDSEGHVHLADFLRNVASDYTPGKALTSKSGTLAYLAPEVYKGTGYSSGADWWSLGVLFYECIYNKQPFEGRTQTSLAAQITKASPNFPVTAPPVSMPCLHAMSSALEEDPQKRMGSIDFETFTDNPFFRAIDFEALERKEVEPVFVPCGEKTNFDATYDLEELLLQESPLQARARRQRPREQLKDDATEKEVREDELYKMIEVEFTPFNYTTAAYKRYTGQSDPSSPNSGRPNDWMLPPPMAPSNTTDDSTPKSIRSHSLAWFRGKSISQPGSPSGSPPFRDAPPLPNGLPAQPSLSSHRKPSNPAPTSHTNPPLLPYQQSYNRRKRPSGTRKESQAGGMQVLHEETGSWSDSAKSDATLPAEAKAVEAGTKPKGMLGFLRGSKGRGHSLKPQERGILGEEGARVVISTRE